MTSIPRTHLTVAAVIERHNRFLLVEERVSGRNVINQPAGHVETGEPLLDAVVREVREETAWDFSPVAIIGVYLWEHPVSCERFLRVVFGGSCSNHDATQPLDDGILRALWMSKDDLLARGDDVRSPMVMRAIDDYEAGTRYPVTMFQHIELADLVEHAQIVG